MGKEYEEFKKERQKQRKQKKKLREKEKHLSAATDKRQKAAMLESANLRAEKDLVAKSKNIMQGKQDRLLSLKSVHILSFCMVYIAWSFCV